MSTFMAPRYSDFEFGVISINIFNSKQNKKYRLICDEKEEIFFYGGEESVVKTFKNLTVGEFVTVRLECFYDVWIEIGELRIPVLGECPQKNISPIEHGNKVDCNRKLKKEYKTFPPPSHNGGYSFDYYPSYYPVVHTQAVTYNNTYIGECNSCVANTLSAIVDFFQNSEGNTQYTRCSTSWIWGGKTDSEGEYGMIYDKALDKLKLDGTPPYELMLSDYVNNFPDNYYYYDVVSNGKTYKGARTIYKEKYNEVLKYAQSQKIDSYEIIEPVVSPVYPFPDEWATDATRLQDVIMDKSKALMMTLMLDQSFDDAISKGDGVVGNLKFSGRYDYGHSLFVVGWKKINGRSYWICQNSWGERTPSGLVFVPFNWTFYDDNNNFDGIMHFYIIRDGSYVMPPLPLPAPPPSPSYDTTRGQNGRDKNGVVYVKTDAIPLGLEYEFKLRYADTGEIFYATHTSNRNFFTMRYGTRAYISVRAKLKNGGYTNYSGENIFTSAPKEPTLSSSSKTNSSITLDATDVATASKVVFHRYNEKNEYIDSREAIVSNGKCSIVWQSLSGKFKFNAVSKLIVDGSSILSVGYSNYILFGTGFDWDIPKVDNNISVTANEWNRLIDIMSKRESLFPLPNKVIAGDSFTALCFGEVVSYLALMENVDPSNLPISGVEKGKEVKAEYFEEIKKFVNMYF